MAISPGNHPGSHRDIAGQQKIPSDELVGTKDLPKAVKCFCRVPSLEVTPVIQLELLAGRPGAPPDPSTSGSDEAYKKMLEDFKRS